MQRPYDRQDRQASDHLGAVKRRIGGVSKREMIADLTQAGVLGGIAAVFIFLSTFALGQIGDTEARVLLESIKPTTRFLGASILGAGATILALMLTLLSLTFGLNRQMDAQHYSRVRHVALFSTLLIIGSTLLLLGLNVPIAETSAYAAWYSSVYYSVITVTAILAGAFIGTVFMLYKAVATPLVVVDPHAPTPRHLLTKAELGLELENDNETSDRPGSS